MARSRHCPCGSGRDYGSCCGLYHRGAEPPDAVTLMRSRYSAYARGDLGYLWRTMHPSHVDRVDHTEGDFVAQVRPVAQSHRFMALVILDHSPEDAEGIARVLFLARVFHAGRDKSFVEASKFVRDGPRWRYLAGTMQRIGTVDTDPMALTLADFDET